MTEKDEGQLVGPFPIIPKQARAQAKREALLRSGSILFVEKGYDQTTAKEIAFHAGVATGTFYRYFSDKRQLLMSLLEENFDLLMPPKPDWNNLDPEYFLSSLISEHFDRLSSVGLHRVLPELVSRDHELAEMIRKAKRKIHEQIYSGLKKAKEHELTWNDLNLDTISWTIMALLEKIPEMHMESGKEPNFPAIAKIICRLVFPPEKLLQLKNNSRDE
ncbi:TetR/AcrR family transcriptional regulator [Robertmurraya massiliosenegalensis]|uniref:TetR/AcrR family transcriptional regulator n=1 Tax=Robertmurraya massiliosenegalensis TaxID=1287657 RepID=UPI00030D822E|nr:TetR/AcrR family transcriptional regulator [Robertmurraya massiliosenegalensis]